MDDKTFEWPEPVSGMELKAYTPPVLTAPNIITWLLMVAILLTLRGKRA